MKKFITLDFDHSLVGKNFEPPLEDYVIATEFSEMTPESSYDEKPLMTVEEEWRRIDAIIAENS